ncbi:response regulator transcription factor [Paenibacillus aceris]|uniref:Two-component system response regulator YesN n=1 Tax=Paenibacillus aceris TaxID=869555 RepID=A0ABS4I226_9BACL|nr:response regulator [Paenibacillus aceris]MBP1964963.1 two-component system response regulator YesN [Paenibacillus aceris]NHW35624.1 response regulator [Paenibacillus aceris]
MYQVMVVEDEQWIRSAVVKMVEQLGGAFEVVAEACNGEEALQTIYQVWPTIVITDIMMPIQDGLWLVREIAERQLPIITIILTGHNEFEYARQALRYHASDFLLKPILEEELSNALEKAKAQIPQFHNLRHYYLSIQQLFDKIVDYDAMALFKEQARIVNCILDATDLQENEKGVLLRTFSSKYNDLIQSMQPDFTWLPFSVGEEVSAHFLKLTEEWLQCYNALNNVEMRQIIRKVCDFLQAHYQEEHSVSDITQRFHISVSQFSLLFKKYKGQSFINYLNSLRIRQAKHMLVDGELKVYEVAEQVGFQSLPHFNRVFKQLTGQSPNEYRKWLNV